MCYFDVATIIIAFSFYYIFIGLKIKETFHAGVVTTQQRIFFNFCLTDLHVNLIRPSQRPFRTFSHLDFWSRPWEVTKLSGLYKIFLRLNCKTGSSNISKKIFLPLQNFSRNFNYFLAYFLNIVHSLIFYDIWRGIVVLKQSRRGMYKKMSEINGLSKT